MTQLLTVCPDCGTPFDRDDAGSTAARCPDCQPARNGTDDDRHRAAEDNSHRRGYDWRWRTLSERARKLQPFCSDCGAVHDLTTDHTPEAWQRVAEGKVIRLEDVDVVCRRCNAERGAARGPRITDHHGLGRLVTDRCPVCRTAITPTTRGNVTRHRDGIGTACPMSGEPWPRREDSW